MTAGHQRKQIVTVYGPGPNDTTLTPVDTLPEPDPDITVAPWSQPTAEDWQARHLRFSLPWSEKYAGMSVSDVTADACAIAARLLTAAGHTGAATLHPLPMVEFKFEYLVRPLNPSAPTR